MNANPTRLFAGGIRPLPPENQPTGIFKHECEMPLWLGFEGLAGDAQADRRVHGGPEQALHQYPVAHYARLAAAFPAAAAQLLPGSLGENLSVPGWDEADVCIGDVFRLGDARIRVSRPRSPCWKIDRRFDVDGMTRLIDDEGLVGWYFAVVGAGEVVPGCDFALLERPAPEASLARLWRSWKAHRPPPGELEMLATTPGLAQRWVQKLSERAAWLKANNP
ncbi:MAG: MOSC domain-containing protein [Gammaproteobacteria bacterium]|nr:MOSC domain-containing protein [Gammaproteobacteria bacterium]MBU1644911.1 MOSC domain-containing protein [Gammaproteobacteria bacterium]MBU1971370.1 MOSC domain-containing protein [Gammaproteobacteria bacterium]